MNVFDKYDENTLKYLIVSQQDSAFKEIMNTNDATKTKYLYNFNNQFYKKMIVCSLENDYEKIEYINELDFKYQFDVIKLIKNDELLLEYYNKCPRYIRLTVMLSIQSDLIKLKHLDDFYGASCIEIIKSLKSDSLKGKCMLMENFKDSKAEILSSFNDKSYIEEYFKSSKNTMFKLELINKIEDQDLKRKLTSLLDKTIYKKIIESNESDIRYDILDSIRLNNINYDVDNEITFGVELEACNDNFREMLMLNDILRNWLIIGDESVNKGIEIISPVLHFDEQSLKELYYVCSMMKKSKCYIDNSCGGHIHLGFDYFKTIKEFQVFLNLYGNTENLLYLISNKKGSEIRNGIFEYARPINDVLSTISNLDINISAFQNVKEYAVSISSNQPSRFYGLNMQNIGVTLKNTIEFRFPNGQIEFNEELNNIRLFCKILEVSKVIANTNNKYIVNQYNELMNNDIDNTDRLNILLDLLFDDNEEKNIYFKRYKVNKSKTKILTDQRHFKI